MNLKTFIPLKKRQHTYTDIILDVNKNIVRTKFSPCYHDGYTKCDKTCHNGGRCESSCVCNSCNTEYIGCNCSGKCNQRSCRCMSEFRVCEKGKCNVCYDKKCCNKYSNFSNNSRLVIGKSKISGWGLFTLDDIKEGEFVKEYIGEYLSNDEEIAKRGAHNKLVQTTYMFGLMDPDTIDSMYMGNKSRFCNHSENGNININVRNFENRF